MNFIKVFASLQIAIAILAAVATEIYRRKQDRKLN